MVISPENGLRSSSIRAAGRIRDLQDLCVAQVLFVVWRSALRRADTVDKAGTDSYGRLRTMGLWRSVGHVLGSLESTWLTGGLA